MKKKLLFLTVALNATSHAHDIFVIESRDNPASESPEKTAHDGVEKVYSPGQHNYILRDGQRISYESVVSEKELDRCFYEHNLATFKEIEKRLKAANLDIFKLRSNGFSLLQRAIRGCHDSLVTHWKSAPTKENSDDFIDYILSKISAEDLNGYVTTSWETGVYYGTAAVVAALRSPSCFEKIINHPLFDKTTFLKKGSSIDVHFFEGFRRYTNLTAADCVRALKRELANECRFSSLSPEQIKQQITILEQTFNL